MGDNVIIYGNGKVAVGIKIMRTVVRTSENINVTNTRRNPVNFRNLRAQSSLGNSTTARRHVSIWNGGRPGGYNIPRRWRRVLDFKQCAHDESSAASHRVAPARRSFIEIAQQRKQWAKSGRGRPLP